VQQLHRWGRGDTTQKKFNVIKKNMKTVMWKVAGMPMHAIEYIQGIKIKKLITETAFG
jgi:hypothetical protein